MSEVSVAEHGHYAIVTLTQPAKRNPISAAMRAAIRTALDDLRAKPVRCLIITGEGSAFCSGLDLDGLAQQAKLSPAEQHADTRSIAEFFAYLAAYPKPTIAAVNGPAVAGGCGVAMLCDITLASETAFFCFSEVKIGFVPALVGVYLQLLVPPKIARELLLTARRVTAAEAKAIGLVNEVTPPEKLLPRAIEIAEQLSQNGPQALQSTKTLLEKASKLQLEAALALAAEVNAQARGSSECQEGVRAFLEKRAPSFGANDLKQ